MRPTSRPAFLRDLATPHLLIFGGKGGVGKTSCAAAAALRLAASQPGKSVLLVSIDPAHSLADSLAGSPVPGNLTVRELDANVCLEQFRQQNGAVLRRIAAAGTYFDDEDLDRLLGLSLPGADELLAFLEIAAWVEQRVYDCIVVDTAPSGHTLRLLEVPALLRRWIGMLNALVAKRRVMRRAFNRTAPPDDIDRVIFQWTASIERLDSLMRDQLACRFVLVTTAGFLAVSETIEFLEKLQALQISVTEVVVNQLRPSNDNCPLCSHLGADERHWLAPLLALAARRHYVLWGIPLQSQEVRGAPRLAALLDSVMPLSAVNPERTEPQPVQPYQSSPRAGALIRADHAGSPLPGFRLALFSGKGGVGKTTLACAAALWFAHAMPERKTLLLSTDPAGSLSRCLGAPAGAEPVAIRPGLDAMEIDANKEFGLLRQNYAADLQAMLQAAPSNIDMSFDRGVLERMIDLVPSGLDELVAMTRIVELLASGRYDTVVVASASTGHFIRLLELPEVMDQWVKTFFNLLLKYEGMLQLPRFSDDLIRLSRNLKRFRALLKDAARSALYAVAIPTQMALEETRDLIAACRRCDVAVPAIFVNLLTPPSDCPFCAELREREELVVNQFDEYRHGLQVVRIPRQVGLGGIEALEALALETFGSPVGSVVHA